MQDALIWGASGGIGAALVRVLAARDWRVFGAARQTERVPAEAAFALPFDLNSPHTLEHVVMRVAQESDGVALMVYAVGDVVYEKLESLSSQAWQQTLQANLTGAFWATAQSLPVMREGGHCVYIGAYLDHLRILRMGAYTAAKAGLQEMVTIWQKENRKHKFTLVRPGAVQTPFWDKVALKLPSDAKQPQVVAEAILAHVEAGMSGELNL